MLEINNFNGDGEAPVISLSEVVAAIPKSVRERLVSSYDMKKLAKIFEDASMMQTAEAFFKCGMNVSRTAREIFMHRNTLIYRIKNIRRETGLDIRDFDMAVTFKTLHELYLLK